MLIECCIFLWKSSCEFEGELILSKADIPTRKRLAGNRNGEISPIWRFLSTAVSGTTFSRPSLSGSLRRTNRFRLARSSNLSPVKKKSKRVGSCTASDFSQSNITEPDTWTCRCGVQASFSWSTGIYFNKLTARLNVDETQDRTCAHLINGSIRGKLISLYTRVSMSNKAGSLVKVAPK